MTDHIPLRDGRPYTGHAHFWQRAMSRRQFIRAAAGAAGGVMSAGVWMPVLAQATTGSAEPRPIPGGLQPLGPGTETFHVFLPELGNELSTITDFIGFIGVAHVGGAGTGTDTTTGAKTHLLFDTDMRFLQGRYVATDGRIHQGTFAFI